jgi:hypothetical protein
MRFVIQGANSPLPPAPGSPKSQMVDFELGGGSVPLIASNNAGKLRYRAEPERFGIHPLHSIAA